MLDQWGRKKSSSTCLSWEGELESGSRGDTNKQSNVKDWEDWNLKGEATVEERQAGLEVVS